MWIPSSTSSLRGLFPGTDLNLSSLFLTLSSFPLCRSLLLLGIYMRSRRRICVSPHISGRSKQLSSAPHIPCLAYLTGSHRYIQGRCAQFTLLHTASKSHIAVLVAHDWQLGHIEDVFITSACMGSRIRGLGSTVGGHPEGEGSIPPQKTPLFMACNLGGWGSVEGKLAWKENYWLPVWLQTYDNGGYKGAVGES